MHYIKTYFIYIAYILDFIYTRGLNNFQSSYTELYLHQLIIDIITFSYSNKVSIF